MLVLAMEFSRGAQRALGATGVKEQTDAGVRSARASGRRRLEVVPAALGGKDSPRAAESAGSEGHSLKTE